MCACNRCHEVPFLSRCPLPRQREHRPPPALRSEAGGSPSARLPPCASGGIRTWASSWCRHLPPRLPTRRLGPGDRPLDRGAPVLVPSIERCGEDEGEHGLQLLSVVTHRVEWLEARPGVAGPRRP